MTRKLTTCMAAVLALFVTVSTWGQSPAASREILIDLLASDEISRIDFVSTSFDVAIGHIETSVDTMIQYTEVEDFKPEDRARALADVIRALDDFKARRDGYNFGDLTLVILDEADAVQLGELIGLTTMMILEDTASRSMVDISAKALFRGVTLDSEEGISPVEQLLDHVKIVKALPTEKRGKFFR